ncbi:MurR/RpiR family transcriptional regulator [Lacrimispora sp.]|uniref:MurR/RpiR family transcriptional regulator n=1 Tax=Lacrimispora sp. TaxID=2719234 RepID=UPI003460B281
MNKRLEKEISRIYADLSKSEKKTADYLLGAQKNFKEMTLEKIAHNAQVSQPTVLRFIKALGYGGFKDFKYEMAGSEREESSKFLYGFPISRQDSIRDVPAKTIATASGQIKETIKSITPEILEQAVQAITHANKIAVYYVENSSCTAQDLVTKLMYLGIHCHCYEDPYMQSVSAANLSKGDVAIGISYSGYSRNTVDAMEIAGKAGAATIAITNFEHTLLAKYSDLVLYTSNQQFLYGNAIFSRVSQLLVVDMIYISILLSDYDKYTEKLDESSRVIAKQAYGSIDDNSKDIR